MRWLVGLNSLRFFAIVLIVVYHLFRRSLPGGFIAVDIFFAISGFLIFSKLLQDYAEHGKINYHKFITRRLGRLFPSLLLCVVLTLTLALLVNRDLLAGIQLRTLAATTFTTNILELVTGGNYENTISPNPFEHTWFLALEMQLYLLLPLLAKFFLSCFRHKKSAIRALGFLLLGLGIISELLMIVYGGFLGAGNRSYFAIDTHMGAFCLAAAFAVFNHLVPRTPRTPKFIPSIGVLMSLLIITILALKTEYADSFTFLFVLPFVGVLAVILLFCIIKLQSNRHSKRTVPLAVRFFEYLGSLSFGIYLFHYPLSVLLPEILSPQVSPWLTPLLTIVGSLVLAWLESELLRPLHLWQKLRQVKMPRAIPYYVLIVLLVAPGIFLLATTPLTSGISVQLASAEQTTNTELDAEVENPDYLGAQALATFADDLEPLIEQTKNRSNLQPGVNRAAPSANAASVLILGDSVTLGAKETLESIIPNSYVDAKESRGIETATNLLAGYSATGRLPGVIVISLATNERTITDALLQGIVDVVGTGRKVILVTAYAGPQQPRESQNAALKAYAAQHEQVFVADWWQLAHDNWSLMYADHIHLNPEGRQAYANLINNIIQGAAR
ncbi:acyltransferase [Candidatus Saccharibacteria bacterium]|nr:acyltransferase [Candidatus Saccharibacteria bacterium]